MRGMKGMGAPVVLMDGKMFGYMFRYIPEQGKRDEFMNAIKNSIPLKMWDGATKRWWVPELYCSIVEGIALEFEALTEKDIERIAGLRAQYSPEIAATFDSDCQILGLQPGAPFRLIEMAAAYWKVTLHAQPEAILEMQAKEAAWERIQLHFQQAAAGIAPMNLKAAADALLGKQKALADARYPVAPSDGPEDD